jgi:hypothetical protein
MVTESACYRRETGAERFSDTIVLYQMGAG